MMKMGEVRITGITKANIAVGVYAGRGSWPFFAGTIRNGKPAHHAATWEGHWYRTEESAERAAAQMLVEADRHNGRPQFPLRGDLHANN